MQTVEFYCDYYVPGTTSKTDPDYADAKTIAEERTGTAFGDKRNLAVAYRILHDYARLDLNENNGLPGNIESEKEGKVAVKYNTNSDIVNKYPELSSTRWGLELIQLIEETIISVDIC